MLRSLNVCVILSACLFSFQSVQGDVVEDFESYASSPALNAVWTPTLGPPVLKLETTIAHGGTKSMNLIADETLSVFFVTDLTFATPKDWSAASDASIWYLGYSSNSAPCDIEFQLINTNNTIIAEFTTNGSPLQVTSWRKLIIPLAGNAGLEAVKGVRINLFPMINGTGSASIYIDDLEVTLPTVSADITASESDGSTGVTEGGSNDTVSVSLASMPANSVTVTPSFVGSILNVTPNPGVITPGSWNSPLNFTISANDDDIIEGTHFGNLTFTTTSPDGNYDNLSTSNINITVTDNESLVTPVLSDPYQEGTNIRFIVNTKFNQFYTVEVAEDPLGTNWIKKIVDLSGLATTNFPIPMDKLSGTVRVTTKPDPSP